MAMGERPLLALLDAAASARMAVGEAVTNIMSANIARIEDIRLSANWMAACGQGDEDARLFDAVKAIGQELCPKLGIAIPVGKDSLSMKSVWSEDGAARTQTAPVSAIISAFAPVADVRRTLTPQLRTDAGDTRLLLVDLGNGRNRLGGSALAQVHAQVGDTPPDLDHPEQLSTLFMLVQWLNGKGQILACHDRSDGGLFVTLAEMSFAGHVGVSVRLPDRDAVGALFCEELGVVLQVRSGDVAAILAKTRAAGLTASDIGCLNADDRVRIAALSGESLLDEPRPGSARARDYKPPPHPPGR
jgi:phosphoribosylformylglycinamidine synthase